MDTNDNN
jgi:hypothetical protein